MLGSRVVISTYCELGGSNRETITISQGFPGIHQKLYEKAKIGKIMGPKIQESNSEFTGIQS